MDLKINGRTALVTGGLQGIGESITKNLLSEGVRVIATSRSQEAINEFLASDFPGKVNFFARRTELTGDNDVQRLVDGLAADGFIIDILVNNAGHTLNVTDPHCSIEDWRNVLSLNFELPIRLVNALTPSMKTRGWGRIVNITSCAGLENSGPVTFSAAKAALTAYTRSMGRVLAIEAPNIVMTAVFPGVVVTKGGHWEHVIKTNPEHAKSYLNERCPLGRFGEVDEIGPVVAFYCSELASFCHGAIVPADGGQSKHYMSFNYMD
jgi:NAD(P)-dependent dehydrogenase (short-subunit alcohol dehydrogenase family)